MVKCQNPTVELLSLRFDDRVQALNLFNKYFDRESYFANCQKFWLCLLVVGWEFEGQMLVEVARIHSFLFEWKIENNFVIWNTVLVK